MSKEIVTQTPLTITALFSGALETAIPTEQLNVILDTPPPAKWVKVHPFISNHKYLPIDKVEYLLRKCFKIFKIEVKETKQLFNAVYCMVRVHYFNPATNEMSYHDGVGAWDLQTQSKSGPLKLDLSNINNGAVPMATGIAKSIAIKDACDHFGSLFGANLNRKDVERFTGDAGLLSNADIDHQKNTERLAKFIANAATADVLITVHDEIEHYGLVKIYDAKMAELNKEEVSHE